VNAFALGLAACHAHRYQLEELRTGLEICLQSNLQLVTSGLEPQIVISQLLVKIISSRTAAAAA
jgi:DNA polymerase-3 subunit delta